MKAPMITSLTFQDGNAEQAMNFYMNLFENSTLISLKRWGPQGPVTEGKVMQALVEPVYV